MVRVNAQFPTLRAQHEEDNAKLLGETFAIQSDEVLRRFDAGEDVLIVEAWDELLADVFFDLNRATARAFAERVAKGLARDFNTGVLDAWLRVTSDNGAAAVNQSTREKLAAAAVAAAAAAGDPREAVAGVYADMDAFLVPLLATSLAGTASNFGAHDAARASGAAVKVWQTNSGNPRVSHAARSGVSRPINGTFAGMKWPGDPAGGVDEVAGCQCSLVYDTEE